MTAEGSPRPWRVSDSDPEIIRDAAGHVVCITGMTGEPTLTPAQRAANAALIVAAVNAMAVPVLPGAWLQATRSTGCARPLEHAAGCECGAL